MAAGARVKPSLTGAVGAATIPAMPRTATKTSKPGGRPRSDRTSALGRWLDAQGRSRDWLVEKLGIKSSSFAAKLARGDALPSIVLAYEIQKLTKGRVGLREWAEAAKTLGR
jgi:hypothetical protein